MRYLTRCGIALVLGLALNFGMVAIAQENEDYTPRSPELADERGFPWLCFVASVAGLAGLFVFVRRREQAVELDHKKGRKAPVPWYCRACDRDVVGSECPRCHAVNPFLQEHSEL